MNRANYLEKLKNFNLIANLSKNLSFYLFYFFICCYTVSLFFSNYTISISTFGLLACYLFGRKADHHSESSFYKRVYQSIIKDPVCIALMSFYLLVLLSGFWSDKLDYWFHHFRILAPIFVLALIFTAYQKVSYRAIHFVMLLLIASMMIQLSIVLFNYFQNFKEINHQILLNKPIPTPFYHIKFSILLASSIIILLYFILYKKTIRWNDEVWIYWVLFVYFIIGIHILSVKTGLLGMYLGVFVMLCKFLISRNKTKVIIILIPAMALMLGIMIYLIPSLNNKYFHLVWQLGEMSRGKYHWYSDVERLQSIQYGWEMIKESPILGSGIGDKDEVTKIIYLQKINSAEYKSPHNQFIFIWAYCGFPAFISLLVIMYFTLMRKARKQNILTYSLFSLNWFSLMVEHGLTSQLGVGIFMWYMMLYWMMNSEGENI